MRDALHSLQPSRLDVIVWSHPDESELHQRVRQIEREGPEAVKPPDGVWQAAREAELIITHMCPIGAVLIRHATHLRTIGVCRAGLETIAVDAARDRSVSVVNVPGRNAIAVVEFPMGLILSERRNIARAHHAIVVGGWRKVFSNHDQETELAEKTIGIIGFGAIGQLVAERLAPFNVHLLVYDPVQPSAQARQIVGQHGGEWVDLDPLLCRSDVVTLHARSEPDQPPLIGVRQLALMKPTAYLINTARAYLVDTDSLFQALAERRIGGAALDIFDDEPIGPDSPLRKLDNVTLTPHLAGSTREAFHRSPYLLVERIRGV